VEESVENFDDGDRARLRLGHLAAAPLTHQLTILLVRRILVGAEAELVRIERNTSAVPRGFDEGLW
jgi:hypothetical protein